MKAVLIPVILAVIGTGAGVGVGLMLQPDAETLALNAENPCGDPAGSQDTTDSDIGPEREYARLNNQFIIPVVDDGRISAMVVMSLNLEVVPGGTAAIFAAEPKLRDGFLQNMFDHANNGGFSGNFTQGSNMRTLRSALLQTARTVIGPDVTDVLILDIVRQDS